MAINERPVRVEMTYADGSKLVFEGEALRLWLEGAKAHASLWASRGWGTPPVFGEAFALAEKIPPTK